MTRFGYGTNGFANHRLNDALAVIADLGYEGVALTLDHDHLDPYADDITRQVDVVARRLDRLGLSVVVETGARYLLDPWRKHRPTLVCGEGRDRRVDLLRRAVRIGADLGAQAVSFWSGGTDVDVPDELAWQYLAAGCAEVVEEATAREISVGLEPEPGMLVDNLDGYQRINKMLGEPDRFGITLDIGHCRCLEAQPVPDCVRRGGDRLVNVQMDDMRRGIHEHLEFGDGEIDFPPVLAALAEVGYRGLVTVELPRHSHAAPLVARRSLRYLRAADGAGRERR
jgi:L-ribulose-5-phosphate 3-epimerase